MIIVLASDNGYVQHCAVTMTSILKNNNNVTFYLLTEFLSENNIVLLSKLVEQNNGLLHILFVESKIVQQFPMPKQMASHISIATYYRLFVTKLLPENVDKIIYMDCDIVVRGSLNELWNTDLKNFALGAVYQQNEWSIIDNSFERLGYPEEFGYFNAGVLLMNLKYWRFNNVSNRLFDFIKQKNELIHSHDQDTLNAVLYKETIALNCKWNFLPSFFGEDVNSYHFPKGVNLYDDILNTQKDPIVVHYVFRPKPWEYACNHPFRSEYFKYLLFTPWYKWRPEFNLNNLLKYKLLPDILAVRRKLLSIFGLR